MKAFLILVLVTVVSVVVADNDSAAWNSKQECWIRKKGVCAKDEGNSPCPFSAGATWHRGCPDGYICCIPPTKQKKHQPITSVKCGYRSGEHGSSDRIVGGHEVKPGEYPWQARIYCDGSHLCGGSIIADRWILSAAHCFLYPCENIRILKIATGLTEHRSPSKQTFKVVQKIVHESYDEHVDNDVILLKLDRRIRFDQYSQPVCIPRRGVDLKDHICTTSGWGHTRENGVNARELRAVNVPVITKQRCRNYYESLNDFHLCAGYKAGGRDSCQNDSGGPLACRMNSGQWVLGGVVSFGNGCARRNYPGVYARVSYFSDWISSKTGIEWH